MMRHGNVVCKCGYNMYFETTRSAITCLQCSTELDVSEYPVIELETNLEEGEEDET